MDKTSVEIITRGGTVEGIIIDGKRRDVGELVFENCYFEGDDGQRRKIGQTRLTLRRGHWVGTACTMFAYVSGLAVGTVFW